MEKILIMGDSYSTFEDCNPEGYELYYPHYDGSNSVTDVSKTWWHMLASEKGFDIILNNSWSGSTVCNTGYSGDCSKTSSFIHRLNELIENGFFEKNKIDRVIVFGGTNDSWTENQCGKLQFSDWTEEDLRLILPGYSYYINKLLGVMPKKNIHIIINSELREDVTQGFIDICKHYDVKYTLIRDIEKDNGHPTYNGMIAIKNQVLDDLE